MSSARCARVYNVVRAKLFDGATHSKWEAQQTRASTGLSLPAPGAKVASMEKLYNLLTFNIGRYPEATSGLHHTSGGRGAVEPP
ncbi:hypothetical protein PoB_003515500 [Plakobranchus ocellatus]|uniref:Uncharacterized protein n=1 Tax=Plakobranchus ocellatus TaxID=259542 RepID=A0AAV4AKF0_9GAST|nr:hypothetical protein PoB_003515500 [Plakobranchus ocellatus]